MPNVDMIFSYTIQDADGERASEPFYFSLTDTQTVADLEAAVVDLGLLINPIIDGAIVKTTIQIMVPLDAGYRLTSAIVAGSEIERAAKFNFPLIAVPGKSYSYVLPTFYLAGFIGNAVNTALTAVANFTTFLTDSAEDDQWEADGLGGLRSAHKVFRKHRKSTSK